MSFLLIETRIFEPAYDDMQRADHQTNTATHDQREEMRPSPVIWIWISSNMPSTVTTRQNKNANAHNRTQSEERVPSQEDSRPMCVSNGVEFEDFPVIAECTCPGRQPLVTGKQSSAYQELQYRHRKVGNNRETS